MSQVTPKLSARKIPYRKPFRLSFRYTHERKEEDVLVADMKRQDDELWARLIHDYGDPLIRFAHSYVHDLDTAQDIVQEVLIRGYRQQQKYPHKPFHAGWLYRVARNLAIDVLRKRQREKPVADLPARLLARESDMTLVTDVEETLRQLTARERDTLWLFYYQEWSITAIAQHHHTTDAVIKGRLYRARKHFLRLWKEEPDESPGTFQ
ncbi:MAG: hypothetical protein C7B43_03640 [Sulfobacillus benefaciens]|jgi:RNA polymerase sigma-70 factor (ECF subfamily)|uniref:Sigma-70 family RNA polymerase sigma factor n=1 Tax=Sulfobacillus benefaciens TaxID=453960 RepID=A0A2T2X925_9FIRM|nr:MAG: hypothetical protein C7B43_03640 [Sulfobacillus benefaciens]HBQ96909.1 hypothetical protein [Sulfobacillus sp.]